MTSANDYDGQGVKCPICGMSVTIVVDTRSHQGVVARRRKCGRDHKFTTVEFPVSVDAAVTKVLHDKTGEVARLSAHLWEVCHGR